MKKIDIKYGVEEYFTETFGMSQVNSLFMINKHEYIAATSKEIIKFEKNEIKMSAPFRFLSACYIPPAQMVIGITELKREFVVLNTLNFAKPELVGFPTNHIGVFHIIYSERSDSIITVGTGIKVWKISYPAPNGLLSEVRKPVKIVLKASFLPTYETSILNEPGFDYEEEHLLLSTPNGIQRYNLMGQEVSLCSRTHSSISTVYSYLTSKRKLVQSDIKTSDICVWNKLNVLSHRYSLVNEAILYIWTITSEFCLIMTLSYNFYLLNLKLGKYIWVLSSQQPVQKIFCFNTGAPVFAVSTSTQCTFYKVILPWNLWSHGTQRPVLIERSPKYMTAARLLVLTMNYFATFYSPRSRAQITSATPTLQSPAVYVFYDRGQYTETDTDKVFICSQDGSVCEFDTLASPCNLMNTYELKASSIVSCKRKNKNYYAVSTILGDLLFCDYETMAIEERYTISASQVVNMLYDGQYIVLVYSEEMFLIDKETAEVVYKCYFTPTNLMRIHESMIYVGYSDGKIKRLEIKDAMIIELSEDICSYHVDQVTGINFGESHWISSSLDGSLNYYDYKCNLFAKVRLPFALYGCEFLNGGRDVICGTETELIIVHSYQVFEGEVDAVDDVYDNFDKLLDVLAPDSVKKMYAEDEEKRLMKLQEDEENKRAKKKRRVNPKLEAFRLAALKRYELYNKPSGLSAQNSNENNAMMESALLEMEKLTNSPGDQMNDGGFSLKPSSEGQDDDNKLNGNGNKINAEDDAEYAYGDSDDDDQDNADGSGLGKSKSGKKGSSKRSKGQGASGINNRSGSGKVSSKTGLDKSGNNRQGAKTGQDTMQKHINNLAGSGSLANDSDLNNSRGNRGSSGLDDADNNELDSSDKDDLSKNKGSRSLKGKKGSNNNMGNDDESLNNMYDNHDGNNSRDKNDKSSNKNTPNSKGGRGKNQKHRHQKSGNKGNAKKSSNDDSILNRNKMNADSGDAMRKFGYNSRTDETLNNGGFDFARVDNYYHGGQGFKSVIPKPIKIRDQAPSLHLWMPKRAPTTPQTRLGKNKYRELLFGKKTETPPPAKAKSFYYNSNQNFVIDVDEVNKRYGREAVEQALISSAFLSKFSPIASNETSGDSSEREDHTEILHPKGKFQRDTSVSSDSSGEIFNEHTETTTGAIHRVLGPSFLKGPQSQHDMPYGDFQLKVSNSALRDSPVATKNYTNGHVLATDILRYQTEDAQIEVKNEHVDQKESESDVKEGFDLSKFLSNIRSQSRIPQVRSNKPYYGNLYRTRQNLTSYRNQKYEYVNPIVVKKLDTNKTTPLTTRNNLIPNSKKYLYTHGR